MNDPSENIKALSSDLDARMENIEAIKGKLFAIAVRASVSMHSIIKLGSSEMPAELRRLILSDLCAHQIKYLCQILDLSKEDAQELVQLAQGICEQMQSEADRMIANRGEQHS